MHQRYQNLILKSMQFEMIFRQKEKENKELRNQIIPLRNVFEQMSHKLKALQSQYETLIQIVKEKDKEIQKLSLIEHQYHQLQRLLYSRSSEKSSLGLPGQLSLALEAELVEACHVNDGQKVTSYTRQQSTREKYLAGMNYQLILSVPTSTCTRKTSLKIPSI